MSRLSNLDCLIVTLCKSPNYGAYLQAFALKEVLTRFGYNVSFLDIYDKENNKKRYRFLFRHWRKNPLSIIFNIRKLFAFRRAEKRLTIVARDRIRQYPVAFIGSDEVWSVTNGTFSSAPEFFGLNLPNIKKFSYAPSVGNSGMEDMGNYPELLYGLNKLDLLSVRDDESYRIATRVTRREDVSVVLDPTFLYDFSDYEEEFNVNVPYLLVYTYGFSDEIVKEVKNYAKRKKLEVVSVGFYNSWADMNIPCNPFEFLSVVKSAECIVTDTFHGSVFAIKYRKDFVSYGFHKKKVIYLLESLGLSENLVSLGYLDEHVTIMTDYSGVDNTLASLEDISREFLKCCNSLVNS